MQKDLDAEHAVEVICQESGRPWSIQRSLFKDMDITDIKSVVAHLKWDLRYISNLDKSVRSTPVFDSA